jgi:hypothetical protein
MTPSSENSEKFIETIEEPGLIVEIHSDVNRDRLRRNYAG